MLLFCLWYGPSYIICLKNANWFEFITFLQHRHAMGLGALTASYPSPTLNSLMVDSISAMSYKVVHTITEH